MISLIVAMAANRCIGRDGQLPWQLPGELQRFKQLTLGHSLLMGRKTFESIGRSLPGRTTYILSRAADFVAEGGQVFSDLEAAIAAADAGGEAELFVCGGAEIYRRCLPLCQKIYLTELDYPVPGDCFFPEFPEEAFRQLRKLRLIEQETYRFRVLERRTL